MNTTDADRLKGKKRFREEEEAEEEYMSTKNPNNQLIPFVGSSSSSRQPSKLATELTTCIINAKQYLRILKETLSKEEYNEFFEIIKAYKEHRFNMHKLKLKITKLFQDHQELISGFNVYLPKEYEIIFARAGGPPDASKQLQIAEVSMLFLDTVKSRLQDDNQRYRSFLKVLDASIIEKISVFDVHRAVAHLFHDHQDLLRQFRSLLPDYHEHTSSKSLQVVHRPMNKRRLEDVINRFPKAIHNQMYSLHGEVMDRLYNSDHYLFLKCIKYCNSDYITRPELQMLVNVFLETCPTLMEQYKGIENRTGMTDGCSAKTDPREDDEAIRGICKRKRSKLSRRASTKYNRPVHEFDLTVCDICSTRTTIDKQVLCDEYYYTENSNSLKHPLKNKYEEFLLKLEDERFELDMFFIRVNATIQQAEELMVRFNEQSVDETDGEFPLEVYFPNSSLSIIKELYRDQGLHVVNSLRTVLSRYLPTILIRLKQKKEQWDAHRSQFNDFNQHWKQSLITKHHKSLDHTAAYLEELDSNIYSDEGLFKEINSISKQRSEKDELLQHVADRKMEYVPQMELIYYDMDIHKDVYQFIRLVSADICSSEQFDKSMKLWTSFVEPFFGLLPQPAARNDENQHYIDITDDIELAPIVDLDIGGFSACFVDNVNKSSESRVFYGNDTFYLFFRLHQAVYTRIQKAKETATSLNEYALFLRLLRQFLSGDFKDVHEYECYKIFGHWSGIIFSVEKLLDNLSEKLIAVTKGRVHNELLDLYGNEKKREPGRTYVDEICLAKAKEIVKAKNVFRVECLNVPETEGETRLTIQKIVFKSERRLLRRSSQQKF